jgi:hypothetical protein
MVLAIPSLNIVVVAVHTTRDLTGCFRVPSLNLAVIVFLVANGLKCRGLLFSSLCRQLAIAAESDCRPEFAQNPVADCNWQFRRKVTVGPNLPKIQWRIGNFQILQILGSPGIAEIRGENCAFRPVVDPFATRQLAKYTYSLRSLISH